MDLDAVRKLIESISAPVICYFYYNPVNGQVIKITNCFEEDEFPYIEIPAAEVDINLSINDYQVIRKDEKFELVKKDKFIDNVPKIDDNIHQIYKRIADPKIKISQVNYSFDMLIEQDNVKKEFRIRVSGVIKDQYYQTSNQNYQQVILNDPGFPVSYFDPDRFFWIFQSKQNHYQRLMNFPPDENSL